MGDDEEKPKSIKVEILDKITALVTAAFGLVAALAWNEAIKAIFKEVFGVEQTIAPMLVYAVIVTIIAVILTLMIARATSKAKTVFEIKKKEIFKCKLCKYETEVEHEFTEHLVKKHGASKETLFGTK